MWTMEKIKYLEGARAVAALIVVFNHFIAAFFPAMYSAKFNDVHVTLFEAHILLSPFNIFFQGNFAVCIFFIISGFVLSYGFFKFKDSHWIISRAIRRYFRLLIPVSFIIFLGYLGMKFSLFYTVNVVKISHSTWLAALWNFSPSFLGMLGSAFYRVFFSYDNSYNTVLWMMTYEFLGSFLIFTILAFFGRSKFRYVVYISLSILFIMKFETYYLAFILGMVMSDIYSKKDNIFEKNFGTVLSAILGLIGLLLGSYPMGVLMNNTTYALLNLNFILNPAVFWHVIGAFLFLVAIFSSGKLKTIFSNRKLVFLGEISFSIYLVHVLVLSSFSCYLFLILYPHLSYLLSFIIIFILSIPLIIFVAYFVTKYIDRPGIRFSYLVYDFVFPRRKY